jgi:hypothetical protein
MLPENGTSALASALKVLQHQNIPSQGSQVDGPFLSFGLNRYGNIAFRLRVLLNLIYGP